MPEFNKKDGSVWFVGVVCKISDAVYSWPVVGTIQDIFVLFIIIEPLPLGSFVSMPT